MSVTVILILKCQPDARHFYGNIRHIALIPIMNISGRRTREPTVRSLAMDELLNDYHALERPTSRVSSQGSRLAMESSVRAGSLRDARVPPSNNTILRLDADGREREQRKVSNRENFVDTGRVSSSLRTQQEMETYEYDSSAENSVHYINDGEPVPTKSRPHPDKRTNRTVDTVIPTVPRLAMPSSSVHDTSFGSQQSRDTEQGACSSPPSSRSEKLQRTLKSISLNEREPFPSVRARIARQRESEGKVKDSRSRLLGNTNNNAVGDSSSAEVLSKPVHTEEDTVELNSSPESVIVRPIKRKVATAPEVSTKAAKSVPRTTATRKEAAKSAGLKTEGPRSKSADWTKSHAQPKWVDKTPGKPRSVSASGKDEGAVRRPPTIRPDSWRQGMAVVNRELKQKQSRQPSREREDSRPNSARSDRSAVSVSSNQKLPAVAQEVLAALNGGDKEDPGVHADEPKSQPQPIRRKTKAKPVETPAPVIKQRHYDTQSIQMFMAKKKKEKRLLEMEERKKRLAAERERQEKLKSLQDRSRKAVSKVAQARAPPTVPLPARTSTSATFTSAKPALAATLMSSGTVWAPPVISSSSYIVNGCADVEQHTDPDIEAECSRLSDQEAGEGDTTLTEADLRAETPTKPFSRPESRVTTPRSRATTPRSTATTPRSTATTPRSTATTPRSTATTPRSRASTPRSKPGSPLSARTRAVEEEIEQLVQAAKHRNQLARQMQAQATPLKMMSQLTSTESTSTESYSASRVQVSSKSARINSLAQTTAQLMNKMNMLKADLENSAMSRSPSRAATSNYDYQWLRSPAGNRASGGGLASSGKVSAKGDQSESTTTEIVTDEEDHTHSTVSDSSKTHSTVTTDSELSDNESELSSLDIRIREALARPTNFSQSIRSQATKPSTDIVKPVAKVARTLMYTESNRGDGHSVINTYLRKLKADREALTCSGRVLPTTSSTHSTGALASTGIQTDMSPTTNSAPPVSNFIQPITSAESSTAARMSHPAVTRPSSQPAMSHVTLHSHTAPNQSLLLRPSLTQSPLTQPTLTEPSLTEPAGQHLQTSVTIRPSQSVPITSQSQSVPITSQSQSAPVTSQSQSVPITSQSQSVPITSQSQNAPITSQSQSVPITSQSHFIPPPSYSARPRTTLQGPAPRISPAGLDLAMTAGISLLEGLNQQQVQLSDVERTRFTALAQQETVALAQILKGSKERQERHLMSLREKIKQDEVEMQQKIAQFKREAELANQRGEDAERQSKVEASRLSRDATRRVLEAQTESTKAFTEASKLLAERRERLNDSENQLATSAKSVVDTLKAQNEVVTASLTTLVDQQRQQNLEILRLARMEPQGIRVADARSPVDRKLLRSPRSSSRTHSPRDRKSPRERKSRKVSSRSPRESSKSPRDASKSPRGTKSPRPRKLRSPADLSFQDIAERSDLSTTSTRHSDGMTHSDSVASYSEDFSSPSGKSSHSKSSPLPRANQLAAHSKSFSVTENIVGGDGDGSSIKTDSEVKSVKEDSINTDISEHSAGSKVSVSAADDSLTSRSRSKSKEETESKSRLSDTGSSSTNGDSPLHKVVLGVVKEVFSDSSSAQLQSDPSFYDKLKSVLYSLKEGGRTCTRRSQHSIQELAE
ncbi:hypothetical protein EB796_015364 [Bugula neritina]|uniref:Uncharacterized protein n=1 Tax=Bugula neritina TaxID=10212 RepID=A0A7J7JJN9_BUGNE|nr:hypothetical protein EB796_015364 [Bugula neritina]